MTGSVEITKGGHRELALNHIIDDQLQEQLSALYRETAREREECLDPDFIQTRLADFETEWNERIQEIQEYEIQGNINAIAYALKERAHRNQFETYFRDVMDFKLLSPEGQTEFLEKYRADNPVISESELARQIKNYTNEIVSATKERFHQLRHDLARSIMDIDDGLEPCLKQTTQHEFYESQRTAAHSIRNELMKMFNKEREKHRQNGNER
jgi:hypothetical protein